MAKIRIGIMVGSDSDLEKQCLKGLLYLQKQADVEVVCVITASIHRNTEEVLTFLDEQIEQVDVWIIGAGWANHLTGICAAYLFYTKKVSTPVIGVAFRDPDSEAHTTAARLSITEVPGTQVIYEDRDGIFIGEDGFRRACMRAAKGDFPDIVPKAPKPTQVRTLSEAIEFAQEKGEEA